MDGRGAQRAADSDREALAEKLRVALNEGRLELHEYDERVRQAYAARTYAELDGLVADLPAGTLAVPSTTAPAVVTPAAVPAAPGVTRKWLGHVWGDYLSVVAITVAIWMVTALLIGDFYYFWPAWVAGPWGAVLAVETVTGLIKGEPARWAVKKERRRLKRKARKAQHDDDGDDDE